MSHLISTELFLGVRLSNDLLERLSAVDQSLLSTFISGEGNYLSKITYGTHMYLGKFAGHVSDLAQLELLQINIYSLLKKLLPEAFSQEFPLELFPVPSART